MSKPQKRRVVPQLVSQAVTPQPAFETVIQKSLKQQVSLKEQAEQAKKLIGPGRRIYVDLSESGGGVNYTKLLKDAGGQRPSKKPPPSLDPDVDDDGPPDLGPALREPGPSKPVNIFASVIQRLERAYVVNGSESEEDSDPAVGHPRSDESDTDAKAGRAPKDDLYDLDDDFIDDGEFLKYYSGDRRKAKYAGFYINKGEIEKVEAHEPTPRRRTKQASQKPTQKAKALPDQAGKKPKRKLATTVTPRAKKLKVDSSVPPRPKAAQGSIAATDAGGQAKGTGQASGRVQAAGDAAVHASASPDANAGGPTLVARGRTPSGNSIPPEDPFTRPSSAAKHPSANGGSTDKHVLNLESKELVDWVSRLGEAAKLEPPPAPSDKKSLPKSLLALLKEFESTYDRVPRELHGKVLDKLMECGLGTFVTRQSLYSLLHTAHTHQPAPQPHAKNATAKPDSTIVRNLKHLIDRRISELKKAGDSLVTAPAVPSGGNGGGSDDDFSEVHANAYEKVVTKDIEDTVYTLITARLQETGTTLRTQGGRGLYKEVTLMFPNGLINETHVAKMYKRRQARLLSSKRNERGRANESIAPAPSGKADKAAEKSTPDPSAKAEKDKGDKVSVPPRAAEASTGKPPAGPSNNEAPAADFVIDLSTS